ncbi:MAG: hypothetical protein WD138_01950, partial [Halofilum sp. (in: g-proteobacteria)]
MSQTLQTRLRRRTAAGRPAFTAALVSLLLALAGCASSTPAPESQPEPQASPPAPEADGGEPPG